jgi:serine/threonine protein kinase
MAMGPDDRLSNYRVEGEIGRGGMAVVYKALQTSLDRTVAIKELDITSSGSAPTIRERFRREARAAAALHHPNITTIHDFWETGSKAYIVMEFVDGPELKEVLAKRGLLEPSIAMLIAIEVCKALSYAHGRGMVHRDIKPGNIMLSASGEVKLTDFGIVLLSESTELTVPGHMLGTPAYMAPEQITGGEVGPASDAFSLGTMLYEMVAGRRPFTGDNPIALTHSILHNDPDPPHSIRPEVPGTLSAIVLKCLAKEPGQRFTTMDELRETLEGVLPSLSSILPEAIVNICRDIPRTVDPTGSIQRPEEKTAPAAPAATPAGDATISSPPAVDLLEDTVSKMADELGVSTSPVMAEGLEEDGDDLQMAPLPQPGGKAAPSPPPEAPQARPAPRIPPEPELAIRDTGPKEGELPEEEQAPRPKSKAPNALMAAITLAMIAGAIYLLSQKLTPDAIKSGVSEITTQMPSDIKDIPAQISEQIPGVGEKSGQAFLVLSVSPWAEIIVDGVPQGRVQGNQTVTVESGPHTVVFRHPQLGEQKVIVDLEVDDSRQITVDLNR